MQRRREREYPHGHAERVRPHRMQILSTTLRHGAKWEQESNNAELSVYAMLQDPNISQYAREKLLRKYAFDDHIMPVSSIRTPSAQGKFQRRQGAKKVKQIEHATNTDQKLTSEGHCLQSPQCAMQLSGPR